MPKHDEICAAQNANPPLWPDAPYQCICPKKRGTKGKSQSAKTSSGLEEKKKARVPNPCLGSELEKVEVPAEEWGVRGPFTPSSKQLGAYAEHHGHTVSKNRDTGRDTFNDDAVTALVNRYPKDPLYAMLPAWRILQKALTAYVAKLRPFPGNGLFWPDGRLHDTFRHTPKTLRLAMELCQVLPRPARGAMAEDDPLRVYDAIRKCFVPSPGHSFVARDYSAIEPKLVAYLMRHTDYLRACILDGHSWFTSHVVGHPLDLTQSDEDVLAHIAELKARGPYTVNGQKLPWKLVRDGCKTAHMTSLYAGGAGEIMRANKALFPTKKAAAYYQDIFFSLCPIKQWHWQQAETAETQGYLVTPTGFRLHAYNLFDYSFSKPLGKWERKLSRVAKEIIAALPQHLGMMYLATSATALAGTPLADRLRLLIHDEIFAEVPTPEVEAFSAALAEVMERPHPLMPLWPEAAALLGQTHLSVKTEGKSSAVSWGDMA